MEPNYSDPDTGFSIWYPEDWAYEAEIEGVIFASSWESIFAQHVESGALMVVFSEELESGQTVEDFLETTLEELYFEEIESSDPKPRRIGGQRGVIVNFEALPEDSGIRLRGFLAGAERDGRGYLFLGASVVDEWSEYGPTLEKMLDSVQFAAVEHVYVNPDLGLTMWYPEDWFYEEDGQEVVFASAEEATRSGDLEMGAGMLVSGSSLGEAFFADWFGDIASEFTFEHGGPTSDRKPRNIAGQSGVMVTLEGVPQGSETPVRGFMAGVEYEGRGYFFLGASVLDEWSHYGPVLEKMLDSVELTSEAGQTGPLSTITGGYLPVPNPCTTSPCLPGIVYAVLADGTCYHLTVDGAWLWSSGESPSWDGYTPEEGDRVTVSGYVSSHEDVSGAAFYEIEVVSLSPAVED